MDNADEQDRPGFGGSTPVPLDQRVNIWLEIVPAVLEKLEVKHGFDVAFGGHFLRIQYCCHVAAFAIPWKGIHGVFGHVTLPPFSS
jgi:hypothetical protein